MDSPMVILLTYTQKNVMIMNRQEIEHRIKTQKFKPRSLWHIFKEKVDRSDMLIDFAWWEGAGEYKAVEFPDKNKTYFIHNITFDSLRMTCQDCGNKLRDDNNFLKPSGTKDKYICDNCESIFESEFEAPLTKIETNESTN